MSSLAALLLLGVMNAAPQAAKTYLIQFKPPLNRAFHYEIDTELKGGTTGSFKISKTVKVASEDRGSTTLVTRFDSVLLGIGPADQLVREERLIKETVITQVFDRQGRLVSSDANRGIASLVGGGLDAVDAIAFSPSPVKVGDTWRSSVVSNGVKLEADFTLLGVSTGRNDQIAHLRMVMVTPPAAGVDAPIALDVDLATGMLRRLEVTTKGAKQGGKDPSMHVVIRLR
ncbi:MAG: hypothetical protein ACYC96_12070 [Fimbriimonadaceae bacterium]